MGWHWGDDGGNQTHPVGQKQPNQFGLYDMHGNVFEWCEDVHDDMFYSKDVPGFDPLSTAGSENRVARGGSWLHLAQYCRSANRYGFDHTTRDGWLGFRPTAPTP